jgi:hypothetical protein
MTVISADAIDAADSAMAKAAAMDLSFLMVGFSSNAEVETTGGGGGDGERRSDPDFLYGWRRIRDAAVVTNLFVAV